jgi:multiple sugar transport system substrate-binding protein
MKKRLYLFLALMLTAIFAVSGCGNGGGDDVELDDEGNIITRPGGKATQITFWGYGDDVEIQVFRRLTDAFNELNDGVIKVNYVQKSSDGYGDNVRLTLAGSKGPDVFYAGDADFKALAEYGYLVPLDDYIEKSGEIMKEDVWESSINRYRYDVATATMDGANAKYWGVPKDIGPTVLFYNESFFQAAGITAFSVAAEALDAFNGGAADSRGKTKTEYGLTETVKQKGYFISGGRKYFNNQIPMSWEEIVACSRAVQTGSSARYGYHTEWWFNYGWSVGGDCIEYIPDSDSSYNGGWYDFTLMDASANFIVADDNADGFTVNGNSYAAGEIISYRDKLVNPGAAVKTVRSELTAGVTAGRLKQLPSQREAFVEFVRLGQPTTSIVDDSLYGYGVTPSPTSIGSDAGKTAAFAGGTVAMLVDGRWNVPNFRAQMDGKYEWDVAPLPVYKQYDAYGDITVHGTEAGHSGSVAVSINAKSKYVNAAWKFIEYIGGVTGQTEQSLSGFAIPSQRSVAATEVFLQSDKNPKNSIIFLKAAEVQTPGDWWYLRDKQWIDPWAGVLNGDVRNGKKRSPSSRTAPNLRGRGSGSRPIPRNRVVAKPTR